MPLVLRKIIITMFNSLSGVAIQTVMGQGYAEEAIVAIKLKGQRKRGDMLEEKTLSKEIMKLKVKGGICDEEMEFKINY